MVDEGAVDCAKWQEVPIIRELFLSHVSFEPKNGLCLTYRSKAIKLPAPAVAPPPAFAPKRKLCQLQGEVDQIGRGYLLRELFGRSSFSHVDCQAKVGYLYE